MNNHHPRINSSGSNESNTSGSDDDSFPRQSYYSQRTVTNLTPSRNIHQSHPHFPHHVPRAISHKKSNDISVLFELEFDDSVIINHGHPRKISAAPSSPYRKMPHSLSHDAQFTIYPQDQFTTPEKFSRDNHHPHASSHSKHMYPNHSSTAAARRGASAISTNQFRGNTFSNDRAISIAASVLNNNRQIFRSPSAKNNFHLKKEDIEPLASQLSDEEGKATLTASSSTDNYFDASILKGILFLFGSAPLSAVAFLPYFFSQFGIVFAITFIISLTSLSHCTFFYLLKCKNLSAKSNYHTIAEFLSGISAQKVVLLIQTSSSFLHSTLLMHYLAQQLQTFALNLANNQSASSSQVSFILSYEFFTYLSFIALLVLALLLPKRKQFSTLISLFNILFILLLTIVTFLGFLQAVANKEMKGDYIFIPNDFAFGYALTSLTVVFLLLDVHAQFFNVFKRLREVSDQKMLRTSLLANMLLGLAYISIGAFGYITMTSTDRHENFFDIPQLYPSAGVQVSLIAYAVYVIVNFPSTFAATKRSLVQLVNIHWQLNDEEHPSHRESQQTTTTVIHHQFFEFPQTTPAPSRSVSEQVFQATIVDSGGLSHFPLQYLTEIEQGAYQQPAERTKDRFITVFGMLAILALSLFCQNPIALIAFAGGICSVIYAFVLPVAFYIKLSSADSSSTPLLTTSIVLLFLIVLLDVLIIIAPVFTLIE